MAENKGKRTETKVEDAAKARTADRKKRAMKYRIPAVILWVLAIGCEVVAVLLFNRNLITPWLWIALAADAALVIAGSLLWKKANHTSPCTSDSKVVCFLQNQMGVIVALLAFIPFGIILLSSDKELKGKQKQLLLIVTAVLVVGAVAGSIDYRPATPESVQAAEEEAAASGDFDGTVYWTQFGKSYHLDRACYTIVNSEVVYEGTIEDAFAEKRFDPCDICAGGDQAKEQELLESHDEDGDEAHVDDADAEEAHADDADEEAEEALDDAA